MKILEYASFDEVRARYIELGGVTPEKFMEDADLARKERDDAVRELNELRLSTGLLIVTCDVHEWSPCTRSDVTVCLRCGERIAGSVAFEVKR